MELNVQSRMNPWIAVAVLVMLTLVIILVLRNNKKPSVDEQKQEQKQKPGHVQEQTFATTPINKVDDYEFSRVFGYERDGHMYIPRQNFNVLLEERTFDWADRPLSSDERRDKYRGLQEGFSTDGDLKSQVIQYKPGEIAKLVEAAYDNDPHWEPVVTKVGANHWEVNELKQRRVMDESKESQEVEEPVVNIQYQYPDTSISESMKEAIDPFFTGLGDLPSDTTRYRRDPYYGPVPGMERMMGPTFDHKKWS